MTNLSNEEYNFILKNDFVTFIERSFYELNPQTQLHLSSYIDLMASKLEDCRRGKIKRLIINIPPRHLKSHCTSIAFVSWLLGHNPGAQIICASYGQDLSDKLSRDCRAIMTSSWYKKLFKCKISTEKNSVSEFATTEQGFRMATSVGGVLTGRGADFIILDDPLKPDDALSEARRGSVNDWYDNTLLSRLNSKKDGCIIIIMQRLHQDDLVGHVLDQDKWEVLSFPAIAEQDESYIIETPLGKSKFERKAGEALHQERESLEVLANLKQTIGEYNFASQYQQNPAPKDGMIIKKEWLHYYITEERPAKFESIIQSWDTANKAGELNDYSVCTTWGKKDKHFYLLNVFRRKMEYPDLKRAVLEQSQIHNANHIIIEDKASGTQLIQELKADGLYGIVAYSPQPGCEKAMRLFNQSSAFENGLVHLPTQASWLADYISELTMFPGGKHDDQIDSTTQALDWMRKPIPGMGILEYYKRLADERVGRH